MITFSVVTITYNAADVLKPTLDSVLRQSFPTIEHIIVDGASTDNTLAIADAYKELSDSAENGHVVRIKSEPDKGLYDAMNKGLARANGDYVVFLNAGDRFPAADTIEKVALAAEVGDGERRPAVVYGDTDIVDEKGNFLYHRRLQPPEKLSWRSFRDGMLVCHQAFYARLDIAKKIPFDTRFRYSADIDWCIKIMREGEKEGLLLRNVHAVIANYLEEGQTTKHHRASLYERFQVMCSSTIHRYLQESACQFKQQTNMITFSVVTITYNAADVLKPTLDSVLRQSFPTIEHIIVDGASTDNTLAIADAYKELSDSAENGHVVRIKSEPDKGLYDAMNKGLARANGDYVVFLNAGDRFPAADTIEKVALAAEVGDGERRPAVVYGDTDIVDEKGNFLYHRRLQPPEKLSWRSFRDGMLVCHQAFYARLDIAKKIPFDTRFRYSADIDWCIKIMREGEKEGLLLRNVHAVIANYLEEGQTTKHHRASLYERFRVMCKHYGVFPTIAKHAWFVVRLFTKK